LAVSQKLPKREDVMKVKELIERLKQLPQDATVINYNEEAVAYNSINDLQVERWKKDTPNGKVDSLVVALYDEIPENFRVEQPVDLCPDCKVYCEKRFMDGRCE
jgi:hypothetical protein